MTQDRQGADLRPHSKRRIGGHGLRRRRAAWCLFRDCAVPVLLMLLLVVAMPASAEDAAPGAEAPPEVARGPVTSLPLPRYVSLKTAEGNVRRGPSLGHRIDWTFVRRDMPLEITDEYGHWRRVRDREGAGGWMHYSLLSGVRTVMVTEPLADLRLKPEPGAGVVARAEAGVVARLDSCVAEWCRVAAGGYRGWVEKAGLWGIAADEVRE